MPHVRIQGPCRAKAYWESFQPQVYRTEAWILKTTHAYLARRDERVVVECTVVEGYLRQHFLAELVQKEDGLLVRIFHASTPEKTEGVRACLAWLASQVTGQSLHCQWDTDNLGLIDHPFRSG